MARKMVCKVSFRAGTLEKEFERECGLDAVLSEVNGLLAMAENAGRHGAEGGKK